MRNASASATAPSSEAAEEGTVLNRRRIRGPRFGKSSSICCSLQESFAPPEQRATRRIHGLQLPLHPQQVVGWLVIIGVAAGTFSVLLPHLSRPIRIYSTGAIIASCLVHLISHLAASLLDPADPQVRSRPSNAVVPEFDRTRHLHVIENGRCHLCNITTSSKRTKHCSVCNKCVRNFDHHCKWLNNCIGGRNYTAFIVSLVSAIVSSLIVVGISIFELTIVNVESAFGCREDKNDDDGDDDTPRMDNATLSLLPLPGTGSLVIISVVGVLSAIAAVLLIHLCFFHGYIACLGLTTYEYVRNKRERNALSNALQTNFSSRIGDSTNSTYCGKSPGTNADLPVRYHFCNSLTTEATTHNQTEATRNVYICSTHTEPNGVNSESNNTGPGSGNREKRNFHLYFSYETRDDATSIELSSSQTIVGGDSRVASIDPMDLKPSTPSPVSCCFSIMNHHAWSSNNSTSANNHNQQQRASGKQKKIRHNLETDEKSIPRSCTTVRRIQTFLRTRLRKNARQRSLNSDASRSRKNKVTPIASPDSDEKTQESTIQQANRETQQRIIDATTKDEETVLQSSRPPVKLPPLNLPSKPRISEINGPTENGVETIFAALPVAKRSQQHLRIRRPSFHRRPRFKMGPHVTQTAQLSPIPESELSKPASPRSPPQLKHFPFPPS